MKKWKRTLGVLTACAMMVTALSGCNTKTSSINEKTAAEIISAAGTVLLSVNPEIEIEYDKGGLVLEIEGKNDDGKKIATTYKNYEGKDCETVVNELVQLIYENGYFEKTVDGKTKNIVVKLEKGSAYPNEKFLKDVEKGVREAVDSCGIDSSAMTVTEKDLNDKGLIGLEKAKELAMAQLGIKDAVFNEKEYELDDGVYELEFIADGIEYDYDVDARTGKILERDIERQDKPITKPVTTTTAKPERKTNDKYIGLDKAKELALKEFGVKNAEFNERDTDFDDGLYELEFVADGVKYECDVDALTGKIYDKDIERFEKTTANTNPKNDYISMEKAKELALKELGIKDAVFKDRDSDLDDGVYELEFTADGVEYEYDINARTGEIIKKDIDRHDDDRYDNDDWDDRYDDDWDDRDDDDRYDDDDWDD